MSLVSAFNMPAWPGQAADLAEQTLAEGFRLCIECGQCCTGGFLSWAPVSGPEIAEHGFKPILPYRDPKYADTDIPRAVSLESLKLSEALTVLVAQYYGRTVLASEAFDGMMRLTGMAKTYRLKFARLNPALRSIEEIFAEQARGVA